MPDVDDLLGAERGCVIAPAGCGKGCVSMREVCGSAAATWVEGGALREAFALLNRPSLKREVSELHPAAPNAIAVTKMTRGTEIERLGSAMQRMTQLTQDATKTGFELNTGEVNKVLSAERSPKP